MIYFISKHVSSVVSATRTWFFGHIAILSSGRIKLFLGSSILYHSMLAQWKSDGFITRKCLDRNEDMYELFGHIAILSSSRIKLFLGSSILYQSMLAQWKSDGFITCMESRSKRGLV